MTASDVPPAAALLRDFVNTADVESGTDELSDVPALTRWLAGRGLLERDAAERELDRSPGGAAPTAADLATARHLREGLRAALAGHHDGSDGPHEELDRLSAQLPLRLAFDGSRPRLVPMAEGGAGALGALLVAVAEAMADGSWERLKACSADTCRWAFYDGSRNRSRTWCAMDVCGNREKTRAYRARRRPRPEDPGTLRG